HQTAAAQLCEQGVLARQAPMLGDVLDLQQKPQVLAAEDDLRYGAVEYAVDAPGRRPGKFALHDAFAAVAHAIEHGQQTFSAACQLCDGFSKSLIGAHSEQSLRGRI